MGCGADIASRIVQLSRSGFGQSDQLLDRLDRQRGMHDQNVGLSDRQRDRRKVPNRVPRRILAQKRQEPKTGALDKQGITVRRRFRHSFIRNNAVAVVYYHPLPPRTYKLLRYDARYGIAAAAGRGCKNADNLVWII